MCHSQGMRTRPPRLSGAADTNHLPSSELTLPANHYHTARGSSGEAGGTCPLRSPSCRICGPATAAAQRGNSCSSGTCGQHISVARGIKHRGDTPTHTINRRTSKSMTPAAAGRNSLLKRAVEAWHGGPFLEPPALMTPWQPCLPRH